MIVSPVMTLLEQQVPITLLCDLLSSSDPDSAAIYRAEVPERDPIRIEVAEHAQDVRDAAAEAEQLDAETA